VSLEERVRSTLREAGARITPSEPAMARPRRMGSPTKRRLRPMAAFLLGAIVVLALGAVALFVGPYDPNAMDPATTHDLETVDIADLAVPVVESKPVLTDPSVWLGLPGPAPQFDTSEYGPDLSFAPGVPQAGDLDDRVTGAVYLGELDKKPFYLYASGAPSVFDWITEIMSGNFSGQIIGTPLDCCTGGDMDREGGLPGVSVSQMGQQPPVMVAQWLGLSPDVSVVAYQFNGQFIGWQTPVGGVVALKPAVVPDEYEMVAFDAEGRELDRYGPYAGPAFGDTATISFILRQGGSEIQPEDLPTQDLRDLIDFQPTDDLFAVPVGEYEVYVLVDESGAPHLFATSCDVVESADLPGWSGTCLERTIDGQRQTGVFNTRAEQG
jgi:hypothetical protein